MSEVRSEVVWLTEPERWDRAVDAAGVHDAFHHAAYHQAMARPGPTALIVQRAGAATWVLPVVLHPVADVVAGAPGWDAIAVYGYTGAAWSPDWRDADHAAAWRATADALRGEGVVSLLVRGHPLLPVPQPLPAGSVLRQEGVVVVMDLGRDDEAYWASMRRDHRGELRRALRDGLRTEVTRDPGRFEAFHALYLATMARVGAGAAYAFDAERLRALLVEDAFGSHLVEAYDDDRLLASALFVAHPPFAHYFLAASAPDPRHGSRPGRLVIHRARELLADAGCRELNLGGGVGAAEDGLFRFKAQFSERRAPFATLRWVLDPERYRDLCAAKGLGVRSDIGSGWFPAYRDPR